MAVFIRRPGRSATPRLHAQYIARTAPNAIAVVLIARMEYSFRLWFIMFFLFESVCKRPSIPTVSSLLNVMDEPLVKHPFMFHSC